MDALTDPSNGTGVPAATKLRRAAAEAGIGPEDPLQPLIEALAEAVATVPEAVRKIEAAAERAGSPLTEQQIRGLAHALATGSHDAVTRLVVEANRKTVLAYAGGVLALVLGGACAGLLLGWGYAEQQNADLVSWGRAAKQACQSDSVVVEHGQKVCRIPLQ